MLNKSVYFLIALVLSLLVAPVVLADAPTPGTVFEGISVPGIALGDTRAEVETANGSPGVAAALRNRPISPHVNLMWRVAVRVPAGPLFRHRGCLTRVLSYLEPVSSLRSME